MEILTKMHIKLRNEATLKQAVCFEGTGVHSGSSVNMIVNPAPESFGIVFKRTDISGKDCFIKLSPESVVDPIMCTRIVNGSGVSVSVVEHLLAAFRICGITNALVEINSDEIPIMDGSAVVFVRSFKIAGIARQDSKVPAILIKSPIFAENGVGRVEITPSRSKLVSVKLEYDRINPVIGTHGKYDFSFDKDMTSIAEARTFGWLEDCEKIKAAGMAKGAGEENTVVIMSDNSIGNKFGLRNPSELVMHKCLDLIGDIFVAGYDIIGSINAINPSHLLNNILMKKLLSEISDHEIIEECEKEGEVESISQLNLATC